MLDTKGPEIRTGLLVDHQPIELVAGQTLQIVTDYAIEGDNTRIACSYRALPETVQVGSTIYVADGALTCEVTEIQEVSKHTETLNETTPLSLQKNNYKIFLWDHSDLCASDDMMSLQYGQSIKHHTVYFCPSYALFMNLNFMIV
jgi:hypothetical protein